MEPIEFAFDLTKADFLSAQRWWMFGRRKKTLLVIFFLVAACTVPSLWAPGGSAQGALEWVVIFAAIAAALWFLPHLTFRRLKPEQLHMQGRLTEARFDLSGALFKMEVDWNILVDQAARKESLMIFTTGNQFYILPARGFASPAGFAAAKELVARKVKKRTGSPWLLKLFIWVVLLLLFFSFYSIFSRKQVPSGRQRDPSGQH